MGILKTCMTKILFLMINLSIIYAKNDYIYPCFWSPNKMQADMVFVKEGPTTYVKHQSGMEKFQLSDYLPGICSHIIYSSADINGLFEAMLYPDQVSQIAELNELKENDPKLKIILSFGSSSILDQLRFKMLASNPDSRKTFATSIKKLMEKQPIDGLFFEWVYPHDKNDKTNYIILLRQLQETLSNSTSDDFSIGIMVPKEVEFIKTGYYISDLSKVVDYVITSPYDIAIDSESVSSSDKDKNFVFKEINDINTRKLASIEATTKFLVNEGLNRSKIVLGLSITALGWTVPKMENMTIQKAVTQFSSSEHRETVYYEICNLLADGAGQHYDVDHNVAYLEYGNEWLVYESERSLQAKADWIKSQHLGGIAIMGLGLDDYGGICKAGQGKRFPLISSLVKQLSDEPLPLETSNATRKYHGHKNEKLISTNKTGQNFISILFIALSSIFLLL